MLSYHSPTIDFIYVFKAFQNVLPYINNVLHCKSFIRKYFPLLWKNVLLSINHFSPTFQFTNDIYKVIINMISYFLRNVLVRVLYCLPSESLFVFKYSTLHIFIYNTYTYVLYMYCFLN